MSTSDDNPYEFRPATDQDVDELVGLYNNVIKANLADEGRQLQWSDFTTDQVAAEVDKGELFTLAQRQSGRLVAAVGLGIVSERDRGAWPDDEGLLPSEGALHVSKIAVDPALYGRKILGRSIGSILFNAIIDYGRQNAYSVIYGEAFSVDSLEQLYRSWGLKVHPARTYRSAYYGRDITARRFTYDLRAGRDDVVKDL